MGRGISRSVELKISKVYTNFFIKKWLMMDSGVVARSGHPAVTIGGIFRVARRLGLSHDPAPEA
jgi:hypothetical protein